MTTALPDLDIETVEEIAVPCEWVMDTADGRITRCELDAKWIVRITCHCGHKAIQLLCDDHYATVAKRGWAFHCGTCGCSTHLGIDVHGEPL